MARLARWTAVPATVALAVWLASRAAQPPVPLAIPPRHAAMSYQAASARVRTWQEQEAGGILPLARLVWRGGTGPAARVVLLLHGFTNSPHQFQEILPAVHTSGCAVLAPRLPRHGLAGDDGRGLRDVSAGELLRFSREVVAVARGLGESVTVAGFSAGGTLTAWIAQHEAVDHAAVIAPALGVFRMGVWANRWGARVASALPDWFIRLEKPSKAMSPIHHYPGTSLRGFSEVLRIGAALQDDALRDRPRARRITVVTNAGDTMVDNATTRLLVDRWRTTGAAVSTREFPRELGLTHDMIDPLQPEAKTELVNPVLVEAIASGCGRP